MKTLRVKVIKAFRESFWYSGAIGKVFTVKETTLQGFTDSYVVHQYGFEDLSYFILKDDCEEVE